LAAHGDRLQAVERFENRNGLRDRKRRHDPAERRLDSRDSHWSDRIFSSHNFEGNLYCQLLFLAVASGKSRTRSKGERARTTLRTTEDCLEALYKLRQNPAEPAARAAIGEFLAHKSSLVVAKAAKLAASGELQGLESQLVEAFHRFMKNPA